jgi:tetratricopeptide (TPR) repeat protein
VNITSAVLERELKASVPDPRFQLDPPSTNPFVSAPSVSLTQHRDELGIEWKDGYAAWSAAASSAEILEEVLQRLRKDVQRFPSSPRSHANLGQALLNCGQIGEAGAAFERAIELDSENYVALASLAKVRVLEGRLDEAEAMYSRLLARGSRDTSPLLSLAYLSIRRGQFESALEQLRRVVRLDPKSALARYHLGLVFLKVGKNREAIAQLRDAARLGVRTPAIYQALGVAYLIAGNHDRAARAFKTALKLHPEMVEAVQGLSLVLLQRGSLEEASLLLTEHLQRFPADLSSREILARIYKRTQRYGQARRQLLKILEALPEGAETARLDRARILNNIGVCLAHEGDRAKAEHLLKQSVELAPEGGPLPYHNLARIYLEDGRIPESQTILRACKDRFPQDENTYLLLASGFERQNRFKEAINELEIALKAGVTSAFLYACLGSMLTDFSRDFQRAVYVLKESLRLYPGDLLLANNLAYALLMQGQAKEARDVLESLPRKQQPAPLIEVYLTATWGLLHLREGDVKKGNELYKSAEKLASSYGNRELAGIVRQKMHLELARGYLKAGDTGQAGHHIQLGLAEKDASRIYAFELSHLRRSLDGSSPEALKA